MNKYEQFKQYPKEPGWYCIGWDREDTAEQEAIGPDMGNIHQFDGEFWTDEEGDSVDSLWCPLLQTHVAMDAADYYIKQ